MMPIPKKAPNNKILQGSYIILGVFSLFAVGMIHIIQDFIGKNLLPAKANNK